MSAIELRGVSKVYGDGTRALRDIHLQVAAGELLVLAGPSGCGKSTLLRLVAGLEEPSTGDILLGGRRINALAPQRRNVAMVFQNYALYPHMTVRRNLEFPLRMQKMPAHRRRRRVEEVAAMLDLTAQLDRLPRALSGGQRQRVAMGRALVRQPAAFLMDEPLSNLDARLRLEIRLEIGRLQRRLGITTLYVTHDQTEAMALGDRLAVLEDGRLRQLDTPEAVYRRPADVFVADFFGAPGMNLLPARVAAGENGGLCLETAAGTLPMPAVDSRPQAGDALVLGFRPEDLRLSAAGEAAPCLKLCLQRREYAGNEQLLYFQRPAPDSVDTDRYGPRVRAILAKDQPLAARLPAQAHTASGAGPLQLALDPGRCRLFDRDGLALD
ncbi:MAG TPA: ABC transporter ATP-binding protein [Gammaproteobacteria bacterium]|nr:ABC transporter ATP-binding protein [Gammaproteobacteria bacterium]